MSNTYDIFNKENNIFFENDINKIHLKDKNNKYYYLFVLFFSILSAKLIPTVVIGYGISMLILFFLLIHMYIYSEKKEKLIKKLEKDLSFRYDYFYNIKKINNHINYYELLLQTNEILNKKDIIIYNNSVLENIKNNFNKIKTIIELKNNNILL